MNIEKSRTIKVKNKTNSNRRSFLVKAGAAMSAGLAAAVPGMAKTSNNDKDLKRRIARLEDEQAIRELHRTYETLLDSGRYGEVADLFTDNAEVIFNGGIYRDKSSGVSRLYNEHFSAGKMGRKMTPAPDFQVAEQNHETIEITEDGQTARARFPYSIQVGAPLQDDSVLVQMARLHGEGIRHWWEGGVYDITMVKVLKDGNWKITRLDHRVLARADYKPGRLHAKTISISPFDKIYPEEATGPDQLVT